MGFEKLDLEEDAKQILINYKWPGNVRELRNVVQRLILNVDTKITAKDLSNPLILRNNVVPKNSARIEEMHFDEVLPLKEIERQFRIKYFKYVKSISSNDSSAADKLGLAPSNFYRMCKELGLK